MESSGTDNPAKERILGDIRRALQRSTPSTPVIPEKRIRQSSEEIGKKSKQKRSDLIEQFESEVTRLGVRFHKAANFDEASQYVEQVALEHQAKQIVTWDSPIIDQSGVSSRLRQRGVDVGTEDADQFLSSAAVSEIGVSGVDYAISDTGTLVVFARKGQARSISLLPPIHIALVKIDQLVSNIGDLFDLLSPVAARNGQDLWSAITFITGPSRTADIELKLVVGVHGPQQLHVVLLDSHL
jgi:L-lactate dehydrogenase complex protein LldG